MLAGDGVLTDKKGASLLPGACATGASVGDRVLITGASVSEAAVGVLAGDSVVGWVAEGLSVLGSSGDEVPVKTTAGFSHTYCLLTWTGGERGGSTHAAFRAAVYCTVRSC